MKELYAKYQNNKHLFVFSLLILIFALYFMPTLMQFAYSIEFDGSTHFVKTQPCGWFYNWLSLKQVITYSKNTNQDYSLYLSTCVIPLIALMLSLMFILLSYKHICFSIGIILINISNIVFFGIANLQHVGTQEIAYMVFSIILNVLIILYCLFLFILGLLNYRSERERLSETPPRSL